MTPTPALLLLTALAFGPQSNTPFPHGPLRNSFASAGETVIDTADQVEIHAEQNRFDPQMQQLHAVYDRLKTLAQDDRENEIAHSLNDLVFAISACHLTALGGGSTEQCEAQVSRARIRSMEALNKHKTASGWEDGPPTE